MLSSNSMSKIFNFTNRTKITFFLNTFIFTKSQHFDGKRSVVSDIMSNDFLGTNRPIHMAAHGLYQEVKQVSQSAPIHTPKII